jgi:MYXO-CTERM domain-containing protein
MRPRPRHALPSVLLGLFTLLLVATFALDARAAGNFKFKSTEVNEVSGAWHLYVTIELPKAPLTAHQPMKFLFTKTAEYERALVDGHDGPVLNRQPLRDQQPSMESLDVDFADPSGKIFKGTRFDFGLTRTRGYVAGEYTVEVRTSDGVTIGTKANITLKGDNEIVDRRAIAFNASEKKIKKVEGVDAGANQANNDDNASGSGPSGNGEVTPTGTGQPFIPKEGYQETDEEKIKTRPKGCGCEVVGARDRGMLALVPLASLGLLAVRRRRSRGA